MDSLGITPLKRNNGTLRTLFLSKNILPELRVAIQEVRDYNEFMMPYRLAQKKLNEENGWPYGYGLVVGSHKVMGHPPKPEKAPNFEVEKRLYYETKELLKTADFEPGKLYKNIGGKLVEHDRMSEE